MARTMFMYTALRYPEDKLYTAICTMAMHYDVWVYNQIPDMYSVLSTIEIWSSSRFDPVPETLSNFHVLGCPTYFLEPKFQNPGVNIPKWDPRS